MNKKLNIALYMRLSVEDGESNESDRIKHQRDLLVNYLENNVIDSNLNLTEFIDDGFSGTNFERPSIKKLLSKIKQNEINCIIVKDFSRFGRSYIEVGNYLEQVFPFMGVRFISVNDNYDSSENGGYTSGLDVVFKNLINELYSRDLSDKIKSAKRIMQNKGLYTGHPVAYGYFAVNGKFVVDKNCEDVVKKIFQMSYDGMSLR